MWKGGGEREEETKGMNLATPHHSTFLPPALHFLTPSHFFPPLPPPPPLLNLLPLEASKLLQLRSVGFRQRIGCCLKQWSYLGSLLQVCVCVRLYFTGLPSSSFIRSSLFYSVSFSVYLSVSVYLSDCHFVLFVFCCGHCV